MVGAAYFILARITAMMMNHPIGNGEIQYQGEESHGDYRTCFYVQAVNRSLLAALFTHDDPSRHSFTLDTKSQYQTCGEAREDAYR